MKFKLLIISLFFTHSAIVFAQSIIDPLKYAQKDSWEHSKGDTGDTSGWQGCRVTQARYNQVVILCQGYMKVLVHGGYPANKAFLCQYVFEKRNSNLYFVKYETCN